MKLPSESRFREIIGKFSTLEPILVLGDVGVDKYTYGKVERISPEAPVPIIEVTKEWDKLGLAANVSDNLIGLQVKNYLCGVMGSDDHGRKLKSLMSETGLETDAMVETGRRTTFKERIVTDVQQICRVDYESTQSLNLEETKRVLSTVEKYLGKSSAVIIEDYGKGMFNFDLCQKTIKSCNEQGKLVVVDPSRKSDPLFFTGASLLKPNQVEAKVMCERLGYQEDDVEVMAKLLIDKLKLQMVIITLGAKGMASMTKESGVLDVIPTVANEVYDVSGAGDTAISVITSSLLAGASLTEASWLGNCASGIVVRKKGTARVSQEELLHFYHKLESRF